MVRVGIIGAGASGIFAAVCAAEACGVEVFEKGDKPLKKVIASGNGQCNISNINPEKSRYHGDPEFAMKTIEHFGKDSVEKFFLKFGVPFTGGRNGKLYPRSFQSSAVAESLLFGLKRLGGNLNLNVKAESVVKVKDKFEIKLAGGRKEVFDKVIISAGGVSFPALGGTDSGYAICSALGHKIIDPFASIVPLNIPFKKVHRLEGIKWNCMVRLFSREEELKRSEGEVHFARYGFSGPAVLDVSRYANDPGIKEKKIVLDLFPEILEKDLAKLILTLFSVKGKSASFALEGVMKKRMPSVFLEAAGFNPDADCGSLRGKSAEIARYLKNANFVPGESRGFADSVAAAGGVCTDEVNPFTMESKKCRGVHITGELLNVDGDTGGFNLHFAWASGALAGRAVRPSE